MSQTELTDTWPTHDAEDATSAPAQRVEYDADQNTCQHCEAVVSTRFVRVFGAEDGTLYCCSECATFRELQNGCAARPGYTPDDGEVTGR